MSINLPKLEQKFNALLDDPNFVAEFEQWLEARNVKPALQQTPCTTLRELLSAKVDEIDKVRERKEKQGLQTGVETGIVLGLKIAFQLIDERQPVA